MTLSPRQSEILRHVAGGRTTKEIAAALGLAESTVDWHISNILVKLDASTRAEAVAIATRDRLLAPADAARRDGGGPVSDTRHVAFDLLGLRLGGMTFTRRRSGAAKDRRRPGDRSS